MTSKKIVSLLLSFLCVQIACVLCSNLRPVSATKSKTIVVAARTENVEERKKLLMHILYHAPFALNSFNVFSSSNSFVY